MNTKRDNKRFLWKTLYKLNAKDNTTAEAKVPSQNTRDPNTAAGSQAWCYQMPQELQDSKDCSRQPQDSRGKYSLERRLCGQPWGRYRISISKQRSSEDRGSLQSLSSLPETPSSPRKSSRICTRQSEVTWKSWGKCWVVSFNRHHPFPSERSADTCRKGNTMFLQQGTTINLLNFSCSIHLSF